jgi:rhodanese-related sulfurtransferase
MGFFSKLFAKPYTTVSPDRAAELVRSGALLVDVRTPGEWRTGHARRAQHMPLDSLPGRIRGLRKDREVIAICASGMRSAAAARQLAAAGLTAYSVRGGMHAWSAAGLD